MKKGMPIITIVVALSFLVSMIAVAPLFAAQATKTTPTTKQQETTQGTAQGTTQVKQVPRSSLQIGKLSRTFWDLEFDCLEVKGVRIKNGMGHKTITAKPGEDVTFTAHYKVKTPPIKDITEADANYWGSGKGYTPYYLLLTIYNVPPCHAPYSNAETPPLQQLPKFTWAEVQQWKTAGLGNTPKIWTENVEIKWHVPDDQVAHNSYFYVFYIDPFKKVSETNEDNNGFNDPGHSLLKISIAP
jgi:hypothetical protein